MGLCLLLVGLFWYSLCEVFFMFLWESGAFIECAFVMYLFSLAIVFDW